MKYHRILSEIWLWMIFVEWLSKKYTFQKGITKGLINDYNAIQQYT